MAHTEGNYPAKQRVTIAEMPDLRVRLLALAEA